MPRREFASTLLITVALYHSQEVTTVRADYSIAAAHRTTRQVGGAAATCADGPLYPVLYNSVPDGGVFITQAFVDNNRHIRDLGIDLLENRTDPLRIIELLTQYSVDPYILADTFHGPDVRQYGVVDLERRAAGYTGSMLGELFERFFNMRDTVQGDVQGLLAGPDGDYSYSVQADPFVTDGSLAGARESLENEAACDLAERLMLALEAGGRDGKEGDIRCVAMAGIAASGAFLHVDNPDGTAHLHLEVVDAEQSLDAVVVLRNQYEEWRSTCPCGEVSCNDGRDDEHDSLDGNKINAHVEDNESKSGSAATSEPQTDDDSASELLSNSKDDWEAIDLAAASSPIASPTSASRNALSAVPTCGNVVIVLGFMILVGA